MITRVVEKIKWLFLISAIRSLGSLKKDFPNIHLPAEGMASPSELISSHHTYVSEVSSPEMAVSFELSDFIFKLCEQNRYSKLLDLGSGFSSFVFRTHALNQSGVTVFSVDDDGLWLSKTQEYLAQLSLSTDNILRLDKFIDSEEKHFDIVLLDLNFVDVRKNYIKLAFDRCKRGGIIIFDDVHKQEYLTEVIKQTSRLPVKLFDIKRLTIDGFGRYSLLGVKQ